MLLLGYNLARFKDMINLSRVEFRLLVVLYTGNCRLKIHLSNMAMASCVNCRIGDIEPETPEHLILHCTAFCRRRLKALISIYVDRYHITSIAPSKFLEFVRVLGLWEYM